MYNRHCVSNYRHFQLNRPILSITFRYRGLYTLIRLPFYKNRSKFFFFGVNGRTDILSWAQIILSSLTIFFFRAIYLGNGVRMEIFSSSFFRQILTFNKIQNKKDRMRIPGPGYRQRITEASSNTEFSIFSEVRANLLDS